MKRRTDASHDAVDLARASADPRSIAVGWVVVFVFIALGAIAPSLAPLLTGGAAAVREAAAPAAPALTVAAHCRADA
jgi:hypothetical protein